MKLPQAAQAAIKLAETNTQHAGMFQDSAQVCIEDALKMLGRGDYTQAIARARKSLAYSVGVLHGAYARDMQGIIVGCLRSEGFLDSAILKKWEEVSK